MNASTFLFDSILDSFHHVCIGYVLVMYWLCMVEGLAKSRLQILEEFFFKSAVDTLL